MLPLSEIRTVGLVGAGSVGAAWAALLLAKGYEVLYTGGSVRTIESLPSRVLSLWGTLYEQGLAETPGPPLGQLRHVADLSELAAASDLVQENGPEGADVKLEIIAAIDAALPPGRLILSSSGGMRPSQLQAACQHPGRCLVGHPFHPAHIIPLVEVVVGGADEEAVTEAVNFYRHLGKRPIVIRQERIGHVTNRLQFSLLREAVACLKDGVASPADIDDALRYGLAPRWALLGALRTWDLAGGAAGIDGLLDKFSSSVQTWWDDLGTVQLDSDTRQAIIDGVHEVRADVPIEEWERWRDGALLSYLSFAATLDWPAAKASEKELA